MYSKNTSEKMSELKIWLKDQPHLPKSASEDEDLLQAFLCNSSINIEIVKLKIDAYFTLRSQYKDPFFKNRNPKMIRWYSVRRLFILPSIKVKTDHVLFTELPSKELVKYYSAEETIKLTFMILDSYIREFNNELFNLYIINDMSKFSNEIGEQLSKEYSRICGDIIEAYPIRIKGIVSFNASPQAEQFCQTVIKQFCGESNRHKINVENGDHKSLTKYIPLEQLPRDYEGGKNLPIKAIWGAVKQKLERERDWFLTFGSETTKESLRK